jgi:putative flippase GtrA
LSSSSDLESPPNLLGFVVAGGLAFVIDGASLWLLTSLGVNPLSGRLVGMALALVAGWWINRSWTYGDPAAPSLAELGRYALSGVVSTGVNYAAFALIIVLWPMVYPLEALVVESGVALAVSFGGYCVAVFNNHA